MREAVGGYEGVRKVWIYFISYFLALWQLFVVYQPLGCAWAASFQGVCPSQELCPYSKQYGQPWGGKAMLYKGCPCPLHAPAMPL